jgi:hypothetical protein
MLYRNNALAVLSLATSLGTCSCGSETGGPAVERGDVERWYAIASNVFLPDSSAGYVIGTSTLEEGELSLRDAVEVGGGGMVYSAGNGSMFVGGFESTDLAKFEVARDGSLEPGNRVSLASYGLTTGFYPNVVQFVDDARAFILTTERIIRWNPSDMTLDGELPMPDMTRSGYDTELGYTTFRRGDELVLTVRWANAESDQVLNETGLLVFDTSTGATAFSSVTGCSGAVWGAEGSDGTIYWSTGAFDAAVYALSDGARAGEPCIVSLPPSESTLSTTVMPLSQWFPGRLAGGLWGVTAGRAVIRLFEGDASSFPAETTSGDLTYRSPWSWHFLNLESGASERIDALGENGGSVFVFDVEDALLVPAIPVTEDSTVFWNVQNGVTAERSLSMPGNAYAAAKVR